MALNRTALLVLLFSLCGLLQAAPTDRYEELTGDQDDFDALEKEWKESTTDIPPLPDDGAWSEVPVDTLPKTQKAYLDLNTLSVSHKDYVVRYWLLVRSNAGGYRATFEGIRCATKEFVIYAYGDPKRDPAVRKVKAPKWKKYGRTKRADYRVELAHDIFCTGEIPRQLRQIKQGVKGLFEAHNPFDNWTNDD